MKRRKKGKVYIALCLMLGMILAPAGQWKVQASQVVATVKGTVRSGTTSELLKLATREGNMEIKMDSGTDTSACKILLPDTTVSVSVSHGSDGYLHAVKIYGDTQEPGVTVDTSNTATVSGTIGEKTKGDVLYFNTPQGEMQIKLDTTTNMSGCSILIVDKTYSIVCARGSDAYMHAISISDAAAVAAAGNGETAGSGLTPAPASPINMATVSVSGTVVSKTKEDLLYLSTSGGEMQFVIDANTDTRSGVVLTDGNKVTVSYYHGNDAYLHAANIVGSKDNAAAPEIDTSAVATVTGTVGSKSTENLLYLDTPQGEMQLKLDAVGSITNCKALVGGKKLSVTCARGSDAYMHALSITGK